MKPSPSPAATTREELLIRAIQAKASCPITGKSCTEPHECTCVRQAKSDGYGN